MADPEQMLAEQVQEELGISESATSPLREAWITGTATAIGALIPVLPFFFFEGRTAVIVAFAVAMLSHWVVGAARSVFTGRSVFRSGMDMFVVGLGVAGVGYFVGEWIGAGLLLACALSLRLLSLTKLFRHATQDQHSSRSRPRRLTLAGVACADVRPHAESTRAGPAHAVGLLRSALRCHGGHRDSGRPSLRRSRRRLPDRRRRRVRRERPAVFAAGRGALPALRAQVRPRRRRREPALARHDDRLSSPEVHGADVRQRRHRDLQRDAGRHAAGLQRRHRRGDSAHRLLGGRRSATACDARGRAAGDDVAADGGSAF